MKKFLLFILLAICCAASLPVSVDEQFFDDMPSTGGGGGGFPSGADVDGRFNGDLLDASGNANDWSMTSGLATYSTNELNVATKSLKFAGSDLCAQTFTGVANYTTQDFSISFWVYVTAADFNNNPVVFSKGIFCNTGYYGQFIANPGFPASLGSFQVTINNGSCAHVTKTAATVMSVGVWYNLVFIRSGTTGKIYSNGVDITDPGSDVLSDPATDTNVLQLGDYPTGGFPFSGVIAQFSTWPRALNLTEVVNIYSGGSL